MRLLLVLTAALALVPPAFAHTNSPPQLALEWPANGTMTSPFGWDAGRPHSGINIGILRSLDVRAAAPGVVVGTGLQRGYEGYGYVVEVRMDYGYSALYAHLSSWSVQRGERVVAGQLLGTAGCTGWCTGTHLHFELRRAGRATDPSLFFG